jgi:hypothetical protein
MMIDEGSFSERRALLGSARPPRLFIAPWRKEDRGGAYLSSSMCSVFLFFLLFFFLESDGQRVFFSFFMDATQNERAAAEKESGGTVPGVGRRVKLGL